MKIKYLVVLIVLISNPIYAQGVATVVDATDGSGIPYANIVVENESIGTSSDENGDFKFTPLFVGKNLKISAVGYKPKSLKFSPDALKIPLDPNVTDLDEVVIEKQRKTLFYTIGEFKKSAVKHFMSASNKTPWMIARFFPYDTVYKATPFLSSVKLNTLSEINGAKFNIRLYGVAENGQPGALLADENIIGTAKRGNRIVEISLEHLKIEFPPAGLFVVYEYIIIDENKYEFDYKDPVSKRRDHHLSYEPVIGCIYTDTSASSWLYKSGVWNHLEFNSIQYCLLMAVALKLSN
ncbi:MULTISPECIES: carboxypeptidase-like regulatory domain-containing protein [unclassified Flavobacterium]|uniref:carboxypeptidase-like regulatory domain-containing protein n=1 Tax=unclassified Flavobacterium TaxID=196869 RepID=UPI0025BC2338|nr:MULTISPECIES: carboxypeptidase-like regulatory domain-containing protein [unclassified Flavobacterium]